MQFIAVQSSDAYPDAVQLRKWEALAPNGLNVTPATSWMMSVLGATGTKGTLYD